MEGERERDPEGEGMVLSVADMRVVILFVEA